MKNSKLIAIILTGTMLSACQPGATGVDGGGLNKADVGTVGGAIGGGVLGSLLGKGTGKVAATIGGALLGGYLGNSVGKSLDNADKAAYDRASQHALESNKDGQSMPWKNPDSGNSGSVTPTSTYQNSDGQYCREYSQTITVGGQTKQAYGNACRQADGSWQIVNN